MVRTTTTMMMNEMCSSLALTRNPPWSHSYRRRSRMGLWSSTVNLYKRHTRPALFHCTVSSLQQCVNGYFTNMHRPFIFTLSLSLRFNGHFPGEPGLAGVYWSKGWWRWWGGDNWTTGAISRAKLQSNHHHQQTNMQFFYRTDALPVAQLTVSKHWREKYHSPWTCLHYPKLTWGFSNFVPDH